MNSHMSKSMLMAKAKGKAHHTTSTGEVSAWGLMKMGRDKERKSEKERDGDTDN